MAAVTQKVGCLVLAKNRARSSWEKTLNKSIAVFMSLLLVTQCFMGWGGYLSVSR